MSWHPVFVGCLRGLGLLTEGNLRSSMSPEVARSPRGEALEAWSR
jgi:hypothetical protein